MPLFRPTLTIPPAGDYSLRFAEGYWFRWTSNNVFLRGKLPIEVGQLLTWNSVVFTVQTVTYLDNGEMQLGVTPPPGVAIGAEPFCGVNDMMTWKLTSDMKRLINLQRSANAKVKKAITPLGKELVQAVKGAAPRQSGALKYSIGMRVIVSKNSVHVIVGPKSKYAKDVTIGIRNPKDIQRIPNTYAKKEEEKTHFLIDQIIEIDKLEQACKREMEFD